MWFLAGREMHFSKESSSLNILRLDHLQAIFNPIILLPKVAISSLYLVPRKMKLFPIFCTLAWVWYCSPVNQTFWWMWITYRREKLPADQLIKRKLTSARCGEVSPCLPKLQKEKAVPPSHQHNETSLLVKPSHSLRGPHRTLFWDNKDKCCPDAHFEECHLFLLTIQLAWISTHCLQEPVYLGSSLRATKFLHRI